MWCHCRVDEWGAYHSPNICYGKSSPSPPAPVVQAAPSAAAQSAANVNTAIAQSDLNDVNQVTPYGDLTYAQTGTTTDPEGDTIPQYTATTTLNPAQTQALNSEETLTNSLYGTANDLSGQITNAIDTPINTSSLAPIPQNPQALDNSATQSVYNEYENLNAPLQQQQTQQTQDQLAQEGFTPSTQGYTTAMSNLMNSQNAANLNAQDQAVQTGASIAGQEFNQDLSANQAGLSEQENLNELPLNEAIALMGGGQIENPSFTSTPQTTVQPTDVLGAEEGQQQAELAQYEAQMGQVNSANTALAGLGGSGLSLAMMLMQSDARLKKELAPLGDTAPIYWLTPVRWKWRADGKNDVGFVAQDMERLIPEAVGEDENGLKFIDFRRVMPFVVAALKELRDQIGALQCAVGALQEKRQ